MSLGFLVQRFGESVPTDFLPIDCRDRSKPDLPLPLGVTSSRLHHGVRSVPHEDESETAIPLAITDTPEGVAPGIRLDQFGLAGFEQKLAEIRMRGGFLMDQVQHHFLSNLQPIASDLDLPPFFFALPGDFCIRISLRAALSRVLAAW